MREIPTIVKELKEIESLGKLQCNNIPIDESALNSSEKSQTELYNTMLFTEELKKLNRDSHSFQDLHVFLQTCVDFLELYPEPVLIVDFKGKIKYVNNRFSSWVGFSHSDLIDTLFFSSPFFSSENERTIIRYALEQNKNQNNTPFELTFQTKKGKHQTGLIHMNSILNPQEDMIGLIISITDITSLKIEKDEASKLGQFQRSIIENENVWLSVCDLLSNVVLWNKAAERISGYSKDEVLGKNSVWELLKLDDNDDKGLVTKKGYTKIDNTIISEDFETFIKRKDGSRRIISWAPRMFFDQFDNPVGTITIGKDITDQKKNEEKINNQNKELLQLNKNLEEKVLERTNKIQDLLDQKNDFINQLGHDLKTPLTPLTVLLPIIENEIEQPDKKQIVDVLIRNTEYMKDLITKTIELAKLNSDMVPLTFLDVNLFEEIDSILKNNKFMFKEKHISVENHVQKDIYVKADYLRLKEIFINLLTNSVKYSNEQEGKIEINADVQSDMVTISVKDNGIGMTPDQMKKIFNEFYKADESRHKLDSNGLGLNITKRLVENHGGTIRVESEGLGKGSMFHFTLKKSNKCSK